MEKRKVFMANSNTISGQSQNTGLPVYSGFSDESEPANAGQEYGKELLHWTGNRLKEAGQELKALFIRITTRIPKWRLNDIDTDSLRKRMSKINWNKDFYSPEAMARSEKSPRLQRDIMRVNSIFRDLKKLSDSGHYMGEELRWKLQYKYWTNTRMQAGIANTLNDVMPSAHYRFPPGTTPPARRQENAVSRDVAPSTRNTTEVSQKQQENEARRLRVAYGGGRLGTSISPRQRRPKKGLGL
jgi:hypothetical protein